MHAAVWLLTLVSTMLPSPAAERGTLAGLAGSQYSHRLQSMVDRALQQTIAAFAGDSLDTAQVAVSLVDLSTPRVEWASTRGQTAIYPASVVKLFYLVAAHQWMADGRLQDSDELRRAMRDMIIDSSNDATSYIVDVLTGTTSGPELPADQLAAWQERRNAVNRYFMSRDYAGINCNKKPWGDGPYGRETQAMKAFEPSRNLLTTDATARILTEIVRGLAASPERTAQMMELLARDPSQPSDDPDNQARGFTGQAMIPGMKLWSKAGWTSRVRHDAAYVELPGGRKFVIVTFTEGHANQRAIIPAIAREIIEGFQAER
jgi:hypothetical protein